MEFLSTVIDLFLHLDQHLETAIQNFGNWIYGLLTLIIFAETGLVVTPFLPGDSLLFAAGAFGAKGLLNAPLLVLLLCTAAIVGDSLNYWIGQRFGNYLIRRHPRILKKEHLDRTHAFFEKYGAKTIVIARFVPIVRTLAPFVAGLGSMSYKTFFIYNVVGGIFWVTACMGAGYLFGNIPIVQENFSLVVLAIILVSVLPAVIAFMRAKFGAPAAPPTSAKPQSVPATSPGGAGGPVEPASRPSTLPD